MLQRRALASARAARSAQHLAALINNARASHRAHSVCAIDVVIMYDMDARIWRHLQRQRSDLDMSYDVAGNGAGVGRTAASLVVVCAAAVPACGVL